MSRNGGDRPIPDEEAKATPPTRRRSPRGQGRVRLVEAAGELFAELGVSGTSLQAIADRLGVTKAAVYHQFATKDEIVLAVASPVIERLRRIADEAEAADDDRLAFTAAVEGLVSLVVEERGVASALRLDPAMSRTLEDHPPYLEQIRRLDRLLVGPDPTVEQRLALAFAGGGLMAMGSMTAFDGVPAPTLHEELVSAMRRALCRDEAEDG